MQSMASQRSPSGLTSVGPLCRGATDPPAPGTPPLKESPAPCCFRRPSPVPARLLSRRRNAAGSSDFSGRRCSPPCWASSCAAFRATASQVRTGCSPPPPGPLPSCPGSPTRLSTGGWNSPWPVLWPASPGSLYTATATGNTAATKSTGDPFSPEPTSHMDYCVHRHASL
ncbi:unnamed protein product [Ixodes persulcatus]